MSSPTGTMPVLPPGRNILATIDHGLGWLFTVLTLLFVLLWLSGRSGADPHGGIFSFIIAVFSAPLGPLFLLAGRGMRFRWRSRWVLQATPILYPLALALAFQLVLE